MSRREALFVVTGPRRSGVTTTARNLAGMFPGAVVVFSLADAMNCNRRVVVLDAGPLRGDEDLPGLGLCRAFFPKSFTVTVGGPVG